MKLICLIKRLARDNPLWGAPRIQKELALLGHALAESTVAKYMPKALRSSTQRWMTFLRNHMHETVACDFFTAPNFTFKVLYVFIIIEHESRRILHFNVAANPTSEWTALQIRQAFMFSDCPPKYLVRDRDAIYGDAFSRTLNLLGIRSIRIARKSPWQNPFAERLIGTVRRECTDHIIPLSEEHLRRLLREYVIYYHQRPHTGLQGDAPIHREPARAGRLVATPVLNGLHHTYTRAA